MLEAIARSGSPAQRERAPRGLAISGQIRGHCQALAAVTELLAAAQGPGKDPQPANMQGYVQTTSDDGGVHINSGIPNHAFYLVATSIGGYASEKSGRHPQAACAGRAPVRAAGHSGGGGSGRGPVLPQADDRGRRTATKHCGLRAGGAPCAVAPAAVPHDEGALRPGLTREAEWAKAEPTALPA